MALNIQGNLNLNNILNQNTEKAVITNSSNNVSRASLEMLKSLLPGTIISGQLLSKEGSNMQLLLNNNLSLSTSLESDANIMAGQKLSFEITGNDGGKLTLRPLHTNLASEETITRALDDANIKITSTTIDMVDTMMKEGMSIDKNSLQAMNRLTSGFDEVFVKDVIMLNKLDMPVTEENVNQMHMYNNNNQWMLKNVEDLADGFTKIISESNPDELDNILSDFKQILDPLGQLTVANEAPQIEEEKAENEEVLVVEETQLPEEKGTRVSTSLLEQLEDAIKELNADNNKQLHDKTVEEEPVKETPQVVAKGTSILEFVKKLDPEMIKNPKMQEYIKDEINNLLSEKMLLKPEKMDKKDYVKSYYDNVNDIVNKLSQSLAENGKGDSALAKDLSGVRSNVDFMNQLNEMYNYIQLPLKMADKHANGDLYVYAKKRNANRNADDGPLTALLHLSMEYLGNMDIFLKLENEKLTTDFKMEKEENIDFIEAHIDELNQRLIAKGYNSDIHVGKADSECHNVIDCIRSESPQITVLSKKGFDARV